MKHNIELVPIDNEYVEKIIYSAINIFRESGMQTTIDKMMKILKNNKTLYVLIDGEYAGFTSYKIKKNIECKLLYIEKKFRSSFVIVFMKNFYFELSYTNNKDIEYVYSNNNKIMDNFSKKRAKKERVSNFKNNPYCKSVITSRRKDKKWH